MALHYWKAIPAARFFSGALWTSNLSLDHIGRHYALFGCASDLIVPRVSRGSYGTSTQTVTVIFPDSWGLDTTFADMKLVLQISVFVGYTGLAVGNEGTIQLVGGSNSRPLDGIRHYLTKDYTTLPTGNTTVTIEMTWSSGPATTAYFERSANDRDGPTCVWQLAPND